MALLNIRKPLPPPDEIEDAIRDLKKKRNAVLLAHYYQESEIQDLADFVGDSLQLSQQAKGTNADVICFAGVHFMAETAKILNPDKPVIIPSMEAGCSLADGCPAPLFKKWLAGYPDHQVISYINCSAEVKALSDVIVTSSNAVKIVKSFPKSQKLVFAPDKYLGAYVQKEADRPDMVLWQGTCIVHEAFSEKKLLALKVEHPDAEIIAHPECEEPLLKMADFIGSTTALLKHAIASPKKEFIVATESGILHQMEKQAPGKTFIPAPPTANCACNECPFMKKNTLENLYLCLDEMKPQIHMDEAIRVRALRPIERMLELSK